MVCRCSRPVNLAPGDFTKCPQYDIKSAGVVIVGWSAVTCVPAVLYGTLFEIIVSFCVETVRCVFCRCQDFVCMLMLL